MAYVVDPQIDAYIDGLPEWQRAICREVRNLVHAADREVIIEDGHGNSTARQISIRWGERINAGALIAMLRQIIANNRAGGWRKIKASR